MEAVYVINRLPYTVLDNKSPYELIYGKTPSSLHMRFIGYLCYATNIRKKDIFTKAIKSVLLGYVET